MTKQQHRGPHRYRRTELGKNKYVVYSCILTNCTHYLSKSLMLGKESLCHRCEGTLILTQEHLRDERNILSCDDCLRKRLERINKLKEVPYSTGIDSLSEKVIMNDAIIEEEDIRKLLGIT